MTSNKFSDKDKMWLIEICQLQIFYDYVHGLRDVHDINGKNGKQTRARYNYSMFLNILEPIHSLECKIIYTSFFLGEEAKTYRQSYLGYEALSKDLIGNYHHRPEGQEKCACYATYVYDDTGEKFELFLGDISNYNIHYDDKSGYFGMHFKYKKSLFYREKSKTLLYMTDYLEKFENFDAFKDHVKLSVVDTRHQGDKLYSKWVEENKEYFDKFTEIPKFMYEPDEIDISWIRCKESIDKDVSECDLLKKFFIYF
jgi:hypothetical protein